MYSWTAAAWSASSRLQSALAGACRRLSTPCTVSTMVATPARGLVRQSCSPSAVIRNQPSVTLTSPAPTSRWTAASTSWRCGIA